MALADTPGGRSFPGDPLRAARGDPEPESRRLFAFLGEAWDAKVLDFDPSEHTATERYRWFTAQRRAAGGERATIYRSRVGTGGRSLDPLLRTLLRRRHGRLLRELGYLGHDEA